MNSCLLLDDVDCEYEEIEDNEPQEQNGNEISLFINEVRPIILKCIKNYFLDKELGLILNDENNISGLFLKNKKIWLEDEDKLQEQFLIENKEFEDIIRNYLNLN